MFFKKKTCNLCPRNQSIKTKTETKDRNDLVTENMKTTMKQLTAGTILTLIMLVGNVNAEGTQAKASSHENAIETTLQVEKWMMDNAVWNTDKMIAYDSGADDSFGIENWMTDANTWNVNNFAAEETEQELKVEDWMIESNWELKSLIAEEQEAPLTTESWMTTGQAWFTGEFDNVLETALAVENWMINDNVWK